MKNIKHFLFLLSILCSLVLFTNCGEDSDDPVADDTSNNIDNANDGSNTDDGGTETLLYLDENGVTIKANEEAVIGESYELDGVSYLVVDYDLLYSIIREDGDLTKVVTSKVTDMNNLFLNLNPNDNISITQSINSWDVSHVTNMSFMFFGGDLFFNQDISSWDVSSVINMEGMFSFSTTFNQDISSWDVSNVTEMSRMFYSTVFNQDIGSWDVSNATSMSGMFGSVNEEGFAPTSFNQDISGWDVSSVTDCEGFSEGTTAWTEPKPTFTNCRVGNEIYLDENGVTIKATEYAVVGESYELGGVSYSVVDLDLLLQMIAEGDDVTKVVTSNVNNMGEMFKDAVNFNQDIGSWDVSNVEIFAHMFRNATSFNQDIGSWDLGGSGNFGNRELIEIEAMFFGASSFNQDIGSWDVSKIVRFDLIFHGASSFNQDIGSWDVSNMETMASTFKDASSFNQDLSSWDVSNVIYCEDFSLEATAWTEPKPNFTNCTE